MNGAAPAARMGFKFVLTVRDGPDVGATFQLLPPRATIGRGADCHVLLNDPRVSRTAASIEFSMEQIVITDISGRQTLLVNGQFTAAASIKDGDLIRIGETEMAFFVEAIPLIANEPKALPGSQMRPTAAPPSGSFGGDTGLSSRQKFYIGLGIAVAAFLLLMMSETKKGKKDSGPRTSDEIQKEIEQSEKKQEELLQKRVFKNDEERTRYEEAQRHFNEGFRDYQKGQWSRAMRSFQTAVTIDPLHQLASRYFKLAEKARDQMISDLTLEGRRYREKSMWARCSAQFEKVLDMIPNKEDLKYKAAEAMKKECDLHLDIRNR
jgi:pSer/pThr/pTyr-binding forkhead associated (FHA) protein